MLLHSIKHLKSRIDADAVDAIEHLGIHAPHRGSYYKVGLFRCAHIMQQSHGIGRMQGHVVSYHHGIGKRILDSLHRTRLG